jgi:2-phosphosulfolactate phosphatase
MKVDFYQTTAAVGKDGLKGATVVVIDVLRATSTILAALESGAAGIIPVDSVETASRLVSASGRGDRLLVGERKGMPIEGFDLFNSPVEVSSQDVEGKTIILATSNGTPAIAAAASKAKRVIICSIVNVDAVAREMRKSRKMTILCGGQMNRFSLEDMFCGGMLLDCLGETIDDGCLNDAASAALILAGAAGEGIEDFLRRTERGRRLIELGYEGDIEYCSRRGGSEKVPEVRQGIILP